MLLPNFTHAVSKRNAQLGLLVAVLMAATVGLALGFQHIGGYIPCKLCLEQRTPYYAAAPLMLAGFVFWRVSAPAYLVRACFAIGAVLMVYGVFLGGFHAGVEWAFWEGPADCAVSVDAPTGTNILEAIDTIKPPSCTEAALRVAGLSFAGWNAIASAGLAYLAARVTLVR
ncbi:MAG: disulfide bond formation protein B [Notoacmeibacter sp.]